MVLYLEDNRLVVRVDESRRDVWKQEPFYSELRSQAQRNGSGRQIIVLVGERSYAIVPQGNIDLGVIGPTDLLVTIEYDGGRRWTVEKMDAADPRVANLRPGVRVDSTDSGRHKA